MPDFKTEIRTTRIGKEAYSSILTTPANVASYLAKGYEVVDVHVPGEYGEQLVRMERPAEDNETQKDSD